MIQIDLDLIKTMPGTHLIDIMRGNQETFARSMKSLQPAPVAENQEFQIPMVLDGTGTDSSNKNTDICAKDNKIIVLI